jgi:hypothetical protein
MHDLFNILELMPQISVNEMETTTNSHLLSARNQHCISTFGNWHHILNEH